MFMKIHTTIALKEREFLLETYLEEIRMLLLLQKNNNVLFLREENCIDVPK